MWVQGTLTGPDIIRPGRAAPPQLLRARGAIRACCTSDLLRGALTARPAFVMRWGHGRRRVRRTAMAAANPDWRRARQTPMAGTVVARRCIPRNAIAAPKCNSKTGAAGQADGPTLTSGGPAGERFDISMCRPRNGPAQGHAARLRPSTGYTMRTRHPIAPPPPPPPGGIAPR
jgi:hypothetical protein